MRGRPQLEHRLGAVSKMVKQSRQSAGMCMRVSWNGRGVHGQEIARIRVLGMTIGAACVSLFMPLGGAGIMRGSVAVTLAIFAIASLIATLILRRVFELP